MNLEWLTYSVVVVNIIVSLWLSQLNTVHQDTKMAKKNSTADAYNVLQAMTCGLDFNNHVFRQKHHVHAWRGSL